jgi:hypothetical protein
LEPNLTDHGWQFRVPGRAVSRAAGRRRVPAVGAGRGVALGHLDGFASWLGLDPASLGDREPSPGGQAYTAWVAWLALNGSATDVALAFLANLAAWGDNCARVSAALRQRYDAGAEATAFFDFFAAPAPGFQEQALAVVEVGLAAGDPPARARRAARLLQAYELMFWDSLLEGGG